MNLCDLKIVTTKDVNLLPQIARLRFEAWHNSGDLTSVVFNESEWLDEHDYHALHWVVWDGTRLVAAQRYCVHEKLEHIPDYRFYPIGRGLRVAEDFPIACLNRLAVSPSLQRLGIAKKLVLAGIEHGRVKKVASMLVSVNHRIKEFMIDQGFIPIAQEVFFPVTPRLPRFFMLLHFGSAKRRTKIVAPFKNTLRAVNESLVSRATIARVNVGLRDKSRIESVGFKHIGKMKTLSTLLFFISSVVAISALAEDPLIYENARISKISADTNVLDGACNQSLLLKFSIYNRGADIDINSITGTKVFISLDDPRVKALSSSLGRNPLRIAEDFQSHNNGQVFKKPGFMSVENAIYQYSIMAEGLNEELANPPRNDDSQKGEHNQIQQSLDTLMGSIVRTLGKAIDQNAIDTDTILFRGEHLPEAVVDGFSSGNVFFRSGFYSTSKLQQVAEDFAKKVKPGEVPVLFRIHVKRGQSALDFAEYAEMDTRVNMHEKEVLLPRGLGFRVTNSVTKSSMTVIDVEVFDQSFKP